MWRDIVLNMVTLIFHNIQSFCRETIHVSPNYVVVRYNLLLLDLLVDFISPGPGFPLTFVVDFFCVK
jgi:hypothetical protein